MSFFEKEQQRVIPRQDYDCMYLIRDRSGNAHCSSLMVAHCVEQPQIECPFKITHADSSLARLRASAKRIAPYIM